MPKIPEWPGIRWLQRAHWFTNPSSGLKMCQNNETDVSFLNLG